MNVTLTSLLYLGYSNISSTSREWIEVLGYNFDISPFFFFNNLVSNHAFNGAVQSHTFEELRSRQPSLEIVCGHRFRAACTLHSADLNGFYTGYYNNEMFQKAANVR